MGNSRTDWSPNTNIDLQTIWQKKHYLIACVVLAVALAAGYLYFADPGASINARVLVWERSLRLNDDRPETTSKEFMPTQAEIIRSRAVISRVLETYQVPTGVTSDDFVLSVIEKLEADPLIGTNVLSLSYRDSDAQRGITIINHIIESYQRFIQEQEATGNRETLTLLTRQDEDLRSRIANLNETHRKLHHELQNQGRFKESAKSREIRLESLALEITRTRQKRIELENHITAIIPADGREGVAQFGDDSKVQTLLASHVNKISETSAPFRQLDLIAKLSKDGVYGVEDPTDVRELILNAYAEHARLRQLYQPKHPQVQAVNEQIKIYESRLNDILRAAPTALQNTLDSLRDQETKLTKVYDANADSAQESLEEAKKHELQLLEEKHLMDEINRLSATHDVVLSRLAQWKSIDQGVSAGRLGVVVRVLEEPTATTVGLAASPKIVFALSAVFGAIGGVLMIMFQGKVQPKSPND